MDIKRLQSYAELIVRNGINPSPGQAVIVTAGLDQPEFVRMVVRECYRAGAGEVVVNFTDMAIDKLDQLYQDEEKLSHLKPWEKSRWQWVSENFPARIWLDSDDPDGMNGIDQDKHSRTFSSRVKEIKPYRDIIENRHQWCIAAVPGPEWAAKVFPGIPVDEAVEKLWEAILSASRANGDALKNWQEHNSNIHNFCQKLNDLRFARLHYKSSNGTDFTVGLMKEGIFCGAAETDLEGRVFNPNIPSEEVFTSPKRGEADGVLVSTKPLSWQGTLIEDFSIRFENGRAVECKARCGQEALEKMISIDDGAAYLGECALIGKNSPINNLGILFYNTLFDENASCHVALGRGFDCCVEDYSKYSKDELKALGINDSVIHVDFMIGADDLEITGTTFDGKKITVFRNGEWAV